MLPLFICTSVHPSAHPFPKILQALYPTLLTVSNQSVWNILIFYRQIRHTLNSVFFSLSSFLSLSIFFFSLFLNFLFSFSFFSVLFFFFFFFFSFPFFPFLEDKLWGICVERMGGCQCWGHSWYGESKCISPL